MGYNPDVAPTALTDRNILADTIVPRGSHSVRAAMAPPRAILPGRRLCVLNHCHAAGVVPVPWAGIILPLCRRHADDLDDGLLQLPGEQRVNAFEPVERPDTDGAPPVDLVATWEPVAAERPGDDRPARPYRDLDTGEVIADPVAYGTELARASQRARRRAMRERLGIPVDASTARSERRSSPEYRKIEKRRERARKAGADPDIMGPDYQLPVRPLTLIERGLLRSAERVGILRKGDLRR